MNRLSRFFCFLVLLTIASTLTHAIGRKKRRNKFPLPKEWLRYAEGVVEREGCKDKRDDCAAYAFPEYCATYWGFMLKHCRRSCRFCDAVHVNGEETTPQPDTTPTTVARLPTFSSECEDVLDDCKRHISDPKYCLSNLAFMTKYCRKTCQLCPTTAPPVCQNHLPDCETFITSPAQCDLNIRGFYTKYCAKACNLCHKTNLTVTSSTPKVHPITSQPTVIRTKPVPRKPTDECKDVIPGCASMVNENKDYCQYQKKFMRDFCAETCQFCERVEPGHREKDKNGGNKQPVEEVKCKDKRPKKCRFYSRFFKYCQRNKRFMRIHCRKSCNFCSTKAEFSTVEV